MKKLFLIAMVLIFPVLGIVAYTFWGDWYDYRDYSYTVSSKLNMLEKSQQTQTTAAELFGPDWQTACLMIGFPYQYQEAEYHWLSDMLGEQIDYHDTPSSFMDDGGISMVVFLSTPNGVVKEAGFDADKWSTLKTRSIECTKNKSAEISYQENLWQPNFEYKFNVETNERIQP
jgi:hypothetical protein